MTPRTCQGRRPAEHGGVDTSRARDGFSRATETDRRAAPSPDGPAPVALGSHPRRRGACGKACFTSEAAAKKSLRGADTYGRGQRWKGRASPYFCRPCAAWHVGHHEDR